MAIIRPHSQQAPNAPPPPPPPTPGAFCIIADAWAILRAGCKRFAPLYYLSVLQVLRTITL